MLQKIRGRDGKSNDVARLAKATIDSFYGARDRAGLAETEPASATATAVVQRDSWRNAVKMKESRLGGR